MNPRPAATGWEQHVRGIAADTVRWVDVVSVQLFVEELDRTRAELSETRRAHKDAEQLWLRCRSELAQVHTHGGAAVAIGQFETAGQVPATVAAKTGPYPHPGNEGDIDA